MAIPSNRYKGNHIISAMILCAPWQDAGHEVPVVDVTKEHWHFARCILTCGVLDSWKLIVNDTVDG